MEKIEKKVKKKKDKSTSPHDTYIRSIMSDKEMAKEFFQKNLTPSIQQRLDFDSLKLEKESFVSDKLRVHIADILYSVNFKDGEQGFLFCLLEHTSTSDKWLPFRMANYIWQIQDRYKRNNERPTLPVVIPTIIYTGKKPYAYSVDLFDLFGQHKDLAREIMLNPCKLIDLTQVSDEEILKYQRIAVSMLALKHIRDAPFLPHFRHILKILNTLDVKNSQWYTKVTLTYIAYAAKKLTKDEFITEVKNNLTHFDEDEIMTVAEQLRQEGKIEGKLEGKLEGYQEMAVKLFHEGMDLDRISSLTGILEEDIKKLTQIH